MLVTIHRESNLFYSRRQMAILVNERWIDSVSDGGQVSCDLVPGDTVRVKVMSRRWEAPEWDHTVLRSAQYIVDGHTTALEVSLRTWLDALVTAIFPGAGLFLHNYRLLLKDRPQPRQS